jgi:PiT family inorganic phosphate transporter
MDVSLIVVVVVVTALVFDFTRGFHDTANAMATSIATGTLRPKVAAAIAGCLKPDRRLRVGPGGEDDLRRSGRRYSHHSLSDLRGTRRGDHVGPDDLAGRAAIQFLARALRPPDRRDLVAGGVDAIQLNTVLNEVILPAVLASRGQTRPARPPSKE